MISNNKISNIVASQLPFFVRNDHQNFIKFLEAYYEYLEQNDKVVNRIKNLLSYQNIDLTEDVFAQKLYDQFMNLIPKDVVVDKKLLVKHIKDFYRIKGTEKSIKFLLSVIFDSDAELYYPKKDVLRFSDGKWFVQKSLRVTGTVVDGTPDDSLSSLEKFIGTQIVGSTSNASAIIERVDRFFEQGSKIDELILSNIKGNFKNGETISTIYYNNLGVAGNVTSNIYGGLINTIEITNAGSGYLVGDPVILLSNTGSGACASIASVSTGNISSVSIVNGGAGFQNNNLLLFTGDGAGTGANGYVSAVKPDNKFHPNAYTIYSSTINLEANTPISNSVYSNLKSANANTSMAAAMNTWVYGNTGPAQLLVITSGGTNYSSIPDISIVANSSIVSLGILGRMNVVNGGVNYRIGDTIEFINVPGCLGTGAAANVKNVDSAHSNAISEVQFTQVPGHYIGGSGYRQSVLPTTRVISNTGSGANIAVTAILGSGASFLPLTSKIGAIERIVITNRGTNYGSNTSVDLSHSGDGTAKATVSVLEGTYTYPGRFLNDDGQLSAYNFIQDRDFYQNFSYVIRSKLPIAKYREILKNLVHPSGMKMWGEFLYVNDYTQPGNQGNTNVEDILVRRITLKPYTKTGNYVNVSFSGSNVSANSIVSLEFMSGDYANVQNGIFSVYSANANTIIIYQSVANNTSGNVQIGI